MVRAPSGGAQPARHSGGGSASRGVALPGQPTETAALHTERDSGKSLDKQSATMLRDGVSELQWSAPRTDSSRWHGRELLRLGVVDGTKLHHETETE